MSAVRVLVVEDEFLIRLVLVEALEDAGMSVIEAANGEQAISVLNKTSDFAVVVTDVQMPGSADGVGVANHVRTWWPWLPIIFTTARPDSVRSFRCRGGDAILPKPYGPDKVVALIRSLSTERS